ncbi:F-box domain containing protein [Tanacetum coccineum]
MDRIPSNIIFDIFSRVPARCLARTRCVSTVWCKYIDDRYLTIIHGKRVVEESTPILYHQHLCIKKITLSLCFHVSESKQAGTTHLVFEPTKGPFLEFLHKKPLSRSSIVRIEARGSCNGLICLSQDEGHVITSLFVIHPLRKECYELPRLPLCFENHMLRESCGLGFDAFTNTYKMVCVLLKEYMPPNKPDMVKKNLCTMVHVFGTNSWREIPQVPSYPITGKAVFANGCLHWLVSHFVIKTEDGEREVIWFDVNKEEFGLIDPPKRMCDLWRWYGCYYDHLVDLNGEVGYVCCRTMEVWVLNKQKEWVPHCRFEKEIAPDGYIDVIGCWNKDGDILIKCIMRGSGRYIFFVYNLKSGVLHETNVAGSVDALSPNIFMYPNTLSSIHGINTNYFSMKKTHLKKSCRDLLSFC